MKQRITVSIEPGELPEELKKALEKNKDDILVVSTTDKSLFSGDLQATIRVSGKPPENKRCLTESSGLPELSEKAVIYLEEPVSAREDDLNRAQISGRLEISFEHIPLLNLFKITDRFLKFLERKKINCIADILEHCPYTVIFTDREGIIRYINSELEKLSGLKADELCGKHAEILFGKEFDRNTLSNVNSLFEREFILKTQTGSRHRVMCLGIPFLDENNNPCGILFFLETISKTTSRIKLARNSGPLAEIMSIARSICHEFGQPLTIISGYVELLLSSLEKGSQEACFIETIGKQAQRMNELLEKLRGFINTMQMKFQNMPEKITGQKERSENGRKKDTCRG